MSTQTTYPSTQPSAVAGLIADMRKAVTESRTVEDAAGIEFGKAVKQGTADKGIAAFDGGTVLAITALDRGATGEDKFAQYESALVLRKGPIWVLCTTGCAAGDPVYVRPSNNTFQNSSANSGVQIANARWETTAAAGELAVLFIG